MKNSSNGNMLEKLSKKSKNKHKWNPFKILALTCITCLMDVYSLTSDPQIAGAIYNARKNLVDTLEGLIEDRDPHVRGELRLLLENLNKLKESVGKTDFDQEKMVMLAKGYETIKKALDGLEKYLRDKVRDPKLQGALLATREYITRLRPLVKEWWHQLERRNLNTIVESLKKGASATHEGKIWYISGNGLIGNCRVDDLVSKDRLDVEKMAKNASTGKLAEFSRAVVRTISYIEGRDGKSLELGTGTLIDLGIPRLKGRVVLTASHCVGSDMRKIVFENNGMLDISKGIHKVGDEEHMLSVYSSGKRDVKFPPIVKSREEHEKADYHVVRIYAQDENCVLILDKAIRDGSGVVKGIKLLAGLGRPCAECDGAGCDSCGHSGVITFANYDWRCLTTGKKTDGGWEDFVIGYGWTGINGGTPTPKVYAEAGRGALQHCISGIGREFAELFGWNRKKAVDISWTRDDVDLTNWYEECSRRIGGGFSGALALSIKTTGEQELRWLGMISGLAGNAIYNFLIEVKRKEL
jgi:hypothetical protein